MPAIYIVAQQRQYGAGLDRDRYYSSYDEAKKELEYWHKNGCEWMKIFTLYEEQSVPEYMIKWLEEHKEKETVS